MEAKEYLEQTRYLDKRIKSDMRELEALKELSVSVRAIGFDERNSTMPNIEAPFVKCLALIADMVEKLKTELQKCTQLRKEALDVIMAVNDICERQVLRYRYLEMMSWRQISNELGTDVRTVRRWHEEALGNVVVPENPTIVE